MTERSVHSIDAWITRAPKPRYAAFAFRLSREAQWRLFILLLAFVDFWMIAAAFRVAYQVRFVLDIPIFNLEILPSFPYYQRLSFTLIPVWLGLFFMFGLYAKPNLLGGTKEYDLVFRATTIGMMLVIIAGFLEPVFIFARGWLVLAWAATFLLTAVGRFALRRFMYRLRTKGYFLTPALIIGANEEGKVLGEQLHGWRRSGLHVMGFIDETLPPGTEVSHDFRVLGNLDSLPGIVERYGVGELILATSALNREQMLDIFRQHGISDQVNLRLSSGLFEIITTGLEVKEVAYVPLVRVHQVKLTGLDEALKLILDYGLGIPVTILLLPLFLIVAIAIKREDGGPVFHRRRVMGLNGTQFDAFKFRSMRLDGDSLLADKPELQEELKTHYKIKDDPRVTRVGKILRKYSIDELPQLFNILRREMSLVGPRMISPPEMREYNQWGINLLTVRPGLTGLWQVSGRSDVSYARRVQLDMQYIRNWSIWLDIYILMQTIPAVLRGTGAY
jgi:exopolysaccharide biosynthesis polyprenyl glycosylphosphotransferase